jgi:uncharacterized protein YdaU (DUF1376 family)
MASEPSPAFQIYPRDFLSDATFMQLSLAAKGAYFVLSMHCWINKTLPAGAKNKKVAALLGCSQRTFSRLWLELAPFFDVLPDGTLIDPRIERIREKQAQFRESQSTKGQASAKVRWSSGSSPVTAPVKARLESGSRSVVTEPQPEGQPKSNSSSSSSSSSSFASTYTHTERDPASSSGPTALPPVVLAGTLPRDFRNTAWVSTRGKHVPNFLHEEFKAAIGGTPESADQRLRAFYEAVQAGWPDGPIGDDPVKLWRTEFAAKFPSVAPVSRAGNGLSRVTESAIRALREARE